MKSKNLMLQATVPTELDGYRLDQVLALLFPDYSRSKLQAWVANKYIQVDKTFLRSKNKVQVGQEIIINAVLEDQITWHAQDIPLTLCYEDADLIIVNKPAGLVVHPAVGNPDKTLVNALLHYAPELAQLPRAGIIHRLDKETSGLLIVARTLPAHTQLISAMQKRLIKREYIALATGNIITGGIIDAPVGRHSQQRQRMAVIATGKPAVTHYRVLKRFPAHTYLHITLETGRTHQIRVHMAHIGHPLLGDPVYGKRLKLPPSCSDELKHQLQTFKRQALHAQRLTLHHPISNQEILCEASLPHDMQVLLDILQSDS